MYPWMIEGGDNNNNNNNNINKLFCKHNLAFLLANKILLSWIMFAVNQLLIKEVTEISGDNIVTLVLLILRFHFIFIYISYVFIMFASLYCLFLNDSHLQFKTVVDGLVMVTLTSIILLDLIKPY